VNLVEYFVAGDPARAKATVVQALESRGFRFTWSGEWDAIAERGSKTANMLAGAFAQYFKVGVNVRSMPDGSSVIGIEKSSKGYMGGAWGASKTNKNFDTLAADLEATFGQAGVLHDTRKA
jgi:hypothetical protein